MNIVAAVALTFLVLLATALLSASAGMGVTLLLPLALVSAGWVAWDAHDIGLPAHRSRLAQPPAVLFVVVALFWPVVFPWYLVTRAKVRAGTLPRRQHAASTNGFAPQTPVAAFTSTAPSSSDASDDKAARDAQELAEEVAFQKRAAAAEASATSSVGCLRQIVISFLVLTLISTAFLMPAIASRYAADSCRQIQYEGRNNLKAIHMNQMFYLQEKGRFASELNAIDFVPRSVRHRYRYAIVSATNDRFLAEAVGTVPDGLIDLMFRPLGTAADRWTIDQEGMVSNDVNGCD